MCHSVKLFAFEKIQGGFGTGGGKKLAVRSQGEPGRFSCLERSEIIQTPSQGRLKFKGFKPKPWFPAENLHSAVKVLYEYGTVLNPIAAIAIKKIPQLPQHGQMGVAAYDAVATPAFCLFCEGFLELFYYPRSGSEEVFNRTGENLSFHSQALHDTVYSRISPKEHAENLVTEGFKVSRSTYKTVEIVAMGDEKPSSVGGLVYGALLYSRSREETAKPSVQEGIVVSCDISHRGTSGMSEDIVYDSAVRRLGGPEAFLSASIQKIAHQVHCLAPQVGQEHGKLRSLAPSAPEVDIGQENTAETGHPGTSTKN